MLDQQMISVLRRKTEAMRARPEAQPSTPPRVFALALGRAARQVLQLDLFVTGVAADLVTQAELLEMPEALSLVTVLEGPRDALGMIAISPPVLAGLIEMQTTGRISGGEAPPRKPTRTDAVMTATFIDMVLQGLEQDLSGSPDEIWAGGFRYASFLADTRPLSLILDDAPMRIMRADVELGAGARAGSILLALPAQGRGVLRKPLRDGAARAQLAREDARTWSGAITRAVMAAPAEVEAVLHRLTLPLSAVMSFAPGTVIPLPEDVLDRVQLQGPGGAPLPASTGQLGAHRGFRAFRLGAPEPEETAQGLGGLQLGDLSSAQLPGAQVAAPLPLTDGFGIDPDDGEDFPRLAPLIGDPLLSGGPV
ncbi:FliM/FliN family flagellar motor switch protein [Halodurantibacterium flavum]|uniref:FliM/FliN family flagellar motor switch protein n=1 Tax=Halodurantibacterium flavum TaxID=1382802 RepID=A0ABW4SB09_9RHOB